jgi:hypothetical protein
MPFAGLPLGTPVGVTLAETGLVTAVKLRTPRACLKLPVPPVNVSVP